MQNFFFSLIVAIFSVDYVIFRKTPANRYTVESIPSDQKQILKNENVNEKTFLINENSDSNHTYSLTEETRKIIPNRHSFQIFDGKNKSSRKLTIKERWHTSKLRLVFG